jgi:hypothetical protein
MTHTLHRVGTEESLLDDYVVLEWKTSKTGQWCMQYLRTKIL